MRERSANDFCPITRADFDARLASEKDHPPPEFQAFFRSVESTVIEAPCFRSEQYGVERVFVRDDLIMFDEVEEEFAVGKSDSDGILRNWGLCGDLIDALRTVQRVR
jgi:hypothetical protein